MVSFPPYLPSSLWYARWLQQKLLTESEEEAIKNANLTELNGRIYARTLIRETNGRELMISLAVEGGGRQLRDTRKIESLKLSEHGNWRKVHSSALEAAYGKFPYYQYFSQELNDIFSDTSITDLKELNLRFHEKIKGFLAGILDDKEFKLLEKKEIIKERGKEIAEDIRPEISIIESLMKYGPETITGIFALRKNS